MEMAYVLEGKDESQRLEVQSTYAPYRPQDELSTFSIKPHSKILDAGCGSGFLSRYLFDHYDNLDIDACDFSDVRLQQARELCSPHHKINFFQSDLTDLKKEDETYDFVICRYVYEHIPADIDKVSREIFRVLKPNGKSLVIDMDGLILNFYTRNKKLRHMLQLIGKGLNCDLFIGRKVPSSLAHAGLKNIDYRVQTFLLSEKEKEEEERLNVQRFQLAKSEIEKSFKGRYSFEEFIELFSREMKKTENPYFFNKFIVTGQK